MPDEKAARDLDERLMEGGVRLYRSARTVISVVLALLTGAVVLAGCWVMDALGG